MHKLWLAALTLTGSAWAGPLGFGIRGGIPLTDFFENVNTGNFILKSSTNRYIIGPSVELHLPAGFGIEVDALYRHFNYNSSFNLVDVFTNNRTTGNAWEFPLMLKYRMPAPVVRPYVGAGVSFDTLTGLTQSITSGANRVLNPGTNEQLKNNTTKGFVIGFGVDIHAVLHFSPEFRYTRWGSTHFALPNGNALSNQNQAEFLLGITF